MNISEVLEASPVLGLAALLFSLAAHFLRGGTLRDLLGVTIHLNDPDDPAVVAIAAGLGMTPQEVSDAFVTGWKLLRE